MGKNFWASVAAFLLFIFPAICQINFNSSDLVNATIANPTSLQFGPDGRLYVAQQDGTIKAFTITRAGSKNYQVTATESILLVKQIPNHFDDGTPKPYNISTNKRQVTGLYVTGTSTNPIIYVASSDNDIGAGSNGDKNLCTNSGIISKLTKSGSTWTKVDLVRGLPRSEENHAPNGIQVDEANGMLYISIGGLTNAGSPSKLFAYISEYALSACVLSVDLNTIEAMPLKGTNTAHPYKYDIPTVDDPTRINNPDGSDINDPFGGNDGLNMAKVVAGGPVQVYASGFRNPYDLVITKTSGKSGRMYVTDNGANPGWGGYPQNEGTANVTNNYVSGEPGSNGPGVNDPMVNNLDAISYVGNIATYTSGSFYGGHPCPIRANPTGAGLYTHSGTLDAGVGVFRTSKDDPNYPLPADWPPVPASMAQPIQGDFQNPGETDNSLITFDVSTNGLCEYTASNFNNALKGNLIAAGFEGALYRVKLNDAGTATLNSLASKRLNSDIPLASGFGSKPLDVTSQGDNQIFPGTIWVVNYASNTITVFEPAVVSCSGADNTSDEDGDGYTNADEIDNNTDPCSAASKPDDFDGDKISDLNDPDDDNDNIADLQDYFVLDKNNGTTTNIPLSYSLFNNDPGTGFFGIGFTGLMSNGTTNYKNQFSSSDIVAGGAAGAISINKVSAGDALQTLNNQENAFQFGINVNSQSPSFAVRTVMMAPFFNNMTPSGLQSQGLYIGKGDQDNYLKVVLNANGGNGGLQVVFENNGTASTQQFSIPKIPSSSVELILVVDPATGKVQPKATLDGGNEIILGNPIQLSGPLLTTLQSNSALAVGIISTSRNATTFNATWDIIEVSYDKGNWDKSFTTDGTSCTARHECAFVQCGDKFYLLGGRGVKNVQEYDPLANTWKTKVKTPIEINHFQAVSYNGLIYALGAMNGPYPDEVPIPNIYIYDPVADKWHVGPSIPSARRRGSAGIVVRDGKIYLAGGIVNGHRGGYVSWLDEYDPQTNTWTILPDAPRARDHFHAAIVNDKLYLSAGRTTSYNTNQVFNLTIPQVDVYDFNTKQWTTLSQNIPTQRAGTAVAVIDDELIVIGGESMAHMWAHADVEALNTKTNTWRKLDTLNQGRHGTQAIVNNNNIYIVAGNNTRGAGAENNLLEVFYFNKKNTPDGSPIGRSTLSYPTDKTFSNVAVGQSKKDSISIAATNGNQGILIKDIKIKNDLSNSFTFSVKYPLPLLLNPNGKLNINLTFSPSGTGQKTATLVIVHSASGDSTLINLIGNPVTNTGSNTPVVFINCGGTQISSTPLNWNEDTQTSPSYNNSSVSTAKTITYFGTNTTDAPTQVFASYRLDGGVAGDPISKEMQYSIPVQTGTHQVNLYFAESSSTNSAVGKRVFDVMIENTIVLDNYDIIADVGFQKAVKKTFTVNVTDGVINIAFLHVVENPIINGISIYKVNTTTSGNLAFSPDTVKFGNQSVNIKSAGNQITLSNNSASSVTVSGINITGNNAADFSHDLVLPKTIAANSSMTFNSYFTPSASGNRSGILTLTHTGTNSPTVIYLKGTGVTTNPSIQVTITSPAENQSFTSPANIVINADAKVSSFSYLDIKCPDNSFRKLKIGNNPTSLYSPKVNVLTGGNNKIEITIKELSTNINWSKIQIRPQGITSNPVVLGNYISTAQADGDYKKIIIPISAFDPSIDFTQISLIEIPYSAGAGTFNIALKKVAFTGGSTPYLWFGDNKTNNIHDGFGGGGQLTATLINSTSAVQISSVEFYNGNTLIGTDNSSPYSIGFNNVQAGNYQLTAKAIANDGSYNISPARNISVVSGTSGLKVVVTFDATPNNVSINTAQLNYNKDFAYSLTLDDGKADAYSNALPLLNGGYFAEKGINYPGLYYTDGCGNKLPFRAGLAWNSLTSTGSDPHVNTPGYLSWDQLKDLYYNKKWNVFNHSLNHQNGSGTDYNYEITQNNIYVKNKTGITLTQFVIPSGDTGYAMPAFNMGMKAVYNQSGNYPGAYGGLKIDGPLSFTQFKLNRKFLEDSKFDTTNIMTAINDVATKSNSTAHFWYNDFTHRVSTQASGGSLIYQTFEYYMKNVEKKYGATGKDNIWMAPLQDVYDYLSVRDNIKYSTSINGNQLVIIFDTTNLSHDLNRYALTLNVLSSVSFSSVQVFGFDQYTYNGNSNSKIINLEWRTGQSSNSISSLRMTSDSSEVIYRVNAGGEEINDPENKLNWSGDANTANIKNQTEIVVNSDSLKIPKEIFNTAATSSDSLSYHFPVSDEGEVEIRLYFSETEFNETDQRIFDVKIDSTIKLKNYDIYKEGGKNKAVVKSYRTRSDGMIDINIIKIKKDPTLNGIEIVCLNNKCNRENVKFSSNKKLQSKAYPNPFSDKLKVDFPDLKPKTCKLIIFNHTGDVIKEIPYDLSGSPDLQVDVSDLLPGIYFLKIITDTHEATEPVKLIKE